MGRLQAPSVSPGIGIGVDMTAVIVFVALTLAIFSLLGILQRFFERL